MEKKRERLMEFLKSLYVPKSELPKYQECLDFIESHELRDIEKSDERHAGLDLFMIKTAGRGKWASFKGFLLCKIDLNKVGEKYAEAYIYRPDIMGYPQRVLRASSTFAIVTEL